MLKSMIFVDHNNFNIAVRQLYLGDSYPRLNYNVLFGGIANYIRNVDLIKTYIFESEPDEFLIKDPNILKYYHWVLALQTMKFTEVVFGRYVARPTNTEIPMNIEDRTSYYKIEKGTDVNFSCELLTKAFHNAYDMAIVMSADTDYIPVYRNLRSIGKLVTLVVIKGQYFERLRPEVDDIIVLDKQFLGRYFRY